MKNISFWERNWLTDYDYVVIGGGIVGSFTALKIASENKKAKVALIERGILPLGASTKMLVLLALVQFRKLKKTAKKCQMIIYYHYWNYELEV